MAETHYLKTWPRYYERVLAREKTFEIRRNDRDYQTGDHLVLQEWRPAEIPGARGEPAGEYTGRAIGATVSYVYAGPGVEDGYVVLGLKDVRTD